MLCVGGTALAFGGHYEPPFSSKVTYKVIDVEDVEDPKQVGRNCLTSTRIALN